MQTRFREIPVHYIKLPQPPIGNKIFCTTQQGVFVLEKGPTIWRALANTHVGTGSVNVYDGIPDENGHFPDANIRMDDPRYATSNGRLLFHANPSVMGMWMLDGGCHHGLTVISSGESNVSAVLTITWLPYKKPERRIVDEK
jgi:hypothetical protein